MIWLGFIAANIFGVWLFVYGILMARIGLGFSGKYRYALFLLVSVVGTCLLYWAWTNGPVSISIGTQ